MGQQNDPYRKLFVFAAVALPPLGVLVTVAGLVVGLVLGNWLVLLAGVVLAALGFAIPVLVVSAIQLRNIQAVNVFREYQTDPEALRRKNPAAYAEIEQLLAHDADEPGQHS